MEYLVMECHTSYAVVLDSKGRFLKVANCNYEVGQEVSTVIEMQEPRRSSLLVWRPALAAAACLCILFTGVWQMMLLSMGTVLIQINPQVRLSVNRMERVISAEAVNADGARILFDYQSRGKTVEQVTEELSDRAAEMGYLTDGGEVHLMVESENARWKEQTESRLQTVIVHDAQNITIIIEHPDREWPDDDDWDDHHEDDHHDDDLDDDDDWDDIDDDQDDIDDDRDDDLDDHDDDHDDDDHHEEDDDHHEDWDDDDSDDDDEDDDSDDDDDDD